jgi:hypothetical protein
MSIDSQRPVPADSRGEDDNEVPTESSSIATPSVHRSAWKLTSSALRTDR